MKIISNAGPRSSHSALRNDGMATVILIALLAIMVILVAAESKALFRLHQEMRFLEKKQIQRLDVSQTNSIASTKPDSK
jgi:hypothetical protein